MHRRNFLTASLGSIAFATLARSHLARAQCDLTLTEPNIEGPFYRPGAPAETDLVDSQHATVITLGGSVLDTCRRPMRDAVIEVWQADEQGEYDMQGYRYRGVLRTDAQARYSVRTVVPGHYLNGASYRPAHIHVKVHATGRPVLTTQLYFLGDRYNDSDPWFRSSLLIQPPPARGCYTPHVDPMRFDFVV